MLNFIITDSDGVKKEICEPITAIINSDLDVPADDLTVTLPYDESTVKGADCISAYNGESLVFKGQIDEITNIKNSSSVITVITARSLAGKLLDNEAEPVTYINPAPEFIFNKHLRPFGITGEEFDSVPFYGYLKIDKGMTHWQALKNFCRNRYDTIPRITADGRVLMTGYRDDEEIEFGGNGIEYYSVKENNKRCGLISEIKIKLKEFGRYEAVIKNPNTDCKGLECVRYVNAIADTSTIKTADMMILQSNTESYLLTLECKGCHIDILGRNAAVIDGVLGKKDGLKVSRLKYSLDSSGEHTTVCLRKEW